MPTDALRRESDETGALFLASVASLGLADHFVEHSDLNLNKESN